ncbi:MAG: hypothetical protein COA79_20425 [Planctomycetota bacterium]|nr:MAG: hypothetical protein COA79_20425 [Planctomycetota bacterium]
MNKPPKEMTAEDRVEITNKLVIDVIRKIPLKDREKIIEAIGTGFSTHSIGDKPCKPHPNFHQYSRLINKVNKYLFLLYPHETKAGGLDAREFYKKYAPDAKNTAELVSVYLTNPIPRKKRGPEYNVTITKKRIFEEWVIVYGARSEAEARIMALAGDGVHDFTPDYDSGNDKIASVESVHERKW